MQGIALLIRWLDENQIVLPVCFLRLRAASNISSIGYLHRQGVMKIMISLVCCFVQAMKCYGSLILFGLAEYVIWFDICKCHVCVERMNVLCILCSC